MINPNEKKNYIMYGLDLLREDYQQEFGELAVGRKLMEYTLEAMESGNKRIRIRNGSWVTEEILDKDFFRRNGMVPVDHFEEMYNLLDKQLETEYQFRRQSVREYIKDLGLGPHTEEIIDGLNQTAERVTIWPDTIAKESCNPLRCREVLQHDGRAVLQFALDYVDRWQMYNQLFD